MSLGFERMKRVWGVSRELSEAMVGWMEKQMAESFALKRELNDGTKTINYFIQILLKNSFIQASNTSAGEKTEDEGC